MNLHLMARGGGRHALHPGVDDLRRLLRHPRHVCRVNFTDGGLLRAESASDPRLADADHGLWDMRAFARILRQWNTICVELTIFSRP